MNTTKWGPYAWTAVHTIVNNLPENIIPEQQEWLHMFFDSMKLVLPCKYCRQSFTKFLMINPLIDKKPDGTVINNLSTRDNMRKWLYNMHNLVNDKLRKQKEGTGDYFPPNPTFEEATNQINETTPGKFTTGLWMFLHAVSMNYEKNPDPFKDIAYHIFFNTLGHLSMPLQWNTLYLDQLDSFASRIRRQGGLFDYIYDIRAALDRTTPSYRHIKQVVSSWKAKCKVFRGWSGGTCR